MRGLELSIADQPAEQRASPSESPLVRSPWVERSNTLLRTAWHRGWSAKPSLTSDAIVRAATTGLANVDFAHRDNWLARLDRLVDALQREARLNELGLTMAFGQLVRVMQQRTMLELLWQRHPEILDVPVPPPIVVLGHMRSGTTRVQRILAGDPRFSATRFCDCWFPMPPSGLDLRPVKAWATLSVIRLLNPQFFAIHPTSPTSPDEEIGWLALDFSTTPYDAQWRIPSFVASNYETEKRPTYEMVKRLLQTHYWRSRGDHRPRILKVPQFMNDIDSLRSVFPEAQIIRVLRDPEAIVASSCSLVANQRMVQSDEVDLHEIGTQWLARTVRREATANTHFSSQWPAVAEVDFAEMDADWRSSVQAIYRGLGLDLTEDLLNRMQREQRSPNRKSSSQHKYMLADFGLTADQVRNSVGSAMTTTP